MKTQLLFLLSFLISCSGGRENSQLSDFAWLQGDWTGGNEEMKTFESWKAPASNSMLGEGGVMMGNDTVFHEKIRIEQRKDGLYYIAKVPGNPAPVEFLFSGRSNDTLIFENKTHDFPQRILYLRTARGLYAAVDGKQKSNYRREEFIFSRPLDK